MSFIETTHNLKTINNFVVWHLGAASIFKNYTDAMTFIQSERAKYPGVKFNGWQESGSGTNMITAISSFDPVAAHDAAVLMLMPRELQ